MPHMVQMLCSFNSVTSEELNLKKWDTMKVIKKPKNDPRCQKLKNAWGQVDLVAKNHVVVFSDRPVLHPVHATEISHTGHSSRGSFAGGSGAMAI